MHVSLYFWLSNEAWAKEGIDDACQNSPVITLLRINHKVSGSSPPSAKVSL